MHKLFLIKAILYRVLGSIATYVISLIFTGSIKLSLGIAVFEFISKVAIYYFYEVFWDKIEDKFQRKDG